MKVSNMLATAGEWLRGEGPHHQIVISSRVRLARNLRNRPFPGWAKKAERSSILELIRSRVAALPEMQEAFAESLQDLSALDRQVLVERHLISREHAAKGAGSAVVVNRRQTLSIMINEEDHLRMQSIRSGLQLKQAFKLVDKIDSALESKLDFAFDSRLGYLTACPTNVGTGMRATGVAPEKTKYAFGPDRSRVRRFDLCACHGLQGSAQPALGHQTGDGFGRVSGRSTSANR